MIKWNNSKIKITSSRKVLKISLILMHTVLKNNLTIQKWIEINLIQIIHFLSVVNKKEEEFRFPKDKIFDRLFNSTIFTVSLLENIK